MAEVAQTTQATRTRVAFIGPYPPIRGGIAQHSACVVRALRALGHRVDVHSWASQYPSLLYGGEQPAVGRGVVEGARFRLRWWSPWSWVEVGRSARSSDVVVVPWVHPFQALALWVVLVVARRPAVGLVHNLTPHERLPGDRLLARWVLGRCVGLLVHAAEVEEETRRAMPSTPIGRVAHPPNLALEPSPPPAHESPSVLFLGYVRPYKGVDVLLDALTRTPAANVRATIAGEAWDPDQEDLEGMLRDRGLEDRVVLETGYVADNRMGQLIADHHVLVAPYRSATQSGLVPLAHAAGRPVVATRVGGLADQIVDGVDGLLVAPEDAEALAEGIARALADWDRLAEGAAAAAPRWDDVARTLDALAAGTHRAGEAP